MADMVCFSPEERFKLAGAITSLENCRFELAANKRLIEERLLATEPVPAISFWQEPPTIIGSVVLSLAAGYFMAKAAK